VLSKTFALLHMKALFLLCSGYMAPEYAMRGYLTDKANIYSFGVVALEVVSGRCNISYQKKDDCFHLLDWVFDSSTQKFSIRIISVFKSLFAQVERWNREHSI